VSRLDLPNNTQYLIVTNVPFFNKNLFVAVQLYVLLFIWDYCRLTVWWYSWGLFLLCLFVACVCSMGYGWFKQWINEWINELAKIRAVLLLAPQLWGRGSGRPGISDILSVICSNMQFLIWNHQSLNFHPRCPITFNKNFVFGGNWADLWLGALSLPLRIAPG